MKNTLLSLILCLCSISTLYSQEISLKYGKVTNDELNMKVYPKDSTAEAAVLYDDGYTIYTYSSSTGFIIESSFKKKIKILKQEGIDYASVSIPYYFTSNSKSDLITGLEAIAYNFENGKIVKTKLEKDYIFTEEINSRYKQVKFSVPNVKVGTVIEYKYKVLSPFAYNLPDWNIQKDIPVLNSRYEVVIPEYFIFNTDMKGYENIERTETQNTEQIEVGSGGTGSEKVTCTNRVLVYSAKDVPALKDESSVWCVKDFRSGVRFELSATKFPNDFYKPYSRTWNDLEETLKNETDFTSNIKTSNPYKDEILTLVSNIKDEKQKIVLVYNFIKEHIRWNGEYSFFGNNPKESVKKGTGNNAQINIILMSALKDANIKSYPILISRRSLGRLPYTYPSLNMLNTFIVAAETSDGNVAYLDGSSVYGGPNVLPTDLLVDRGYIFEPGHSEKWVDLTNISKNSQRSLLKASLDKDGILKGVFNILYTNQKALDYKTAFFAAKDSLEYIEKIQNASQIKVDSFYIEGKEKISNSVKEKLVFNKQLDTNGDYIYINPLVFTHLTKNFFTQTERKLPIEFNYPYMYSSICYITIPENYQIEEIPKSQHILLNNNEGKFMYNITQNGNEIQLGYQFQINQTIFPFTDYPYIRDFYGLVATKNTEMIVLKKKQS